MSRKPAKRPQAKKAARPTTSKKVVAKKSAPAVRAKAAQPAVVAPKSTAPTQPVVKAASAGLGKRIFAYALVGLVLLGVGYLAYSITQYTRSPAFTLQQVIEAAKNRDLEAFDRYVDTTRLSAYLVDDLLTQPEAAALPQGTGQTQAELLNLLKPGLSKTVEDQMKALVQQGVENAGEGNLLATLVGKIWTAESSFAGFKPISQDAQTAVVGLDLYRAEFNDTLTLEVRLVKTEAGWEVAAIDNLPAVMQRLDRLEAGRRDSVNKTLAEQIAAQIRLRDFQKGTSGDDNSTLLLRLSFENTGPQAIVGFAAAVTLFDAERIVLGQFNVTSDKPLAVGEFVEQAWPFKLDLSNAEQARLATTPTTSLGRQVEVYSLSLADGTTLVLEK